MLKQQAQRNQEIATTILAQLGGNRFKAMTGAHSFSADLNCLIFKLPKGKSVKITLNGKDLYDVEFWSIRGFNVNKTATEADVYAEDLQRIFTEHTGLATSL